jgi:DNA-binding NarL/FixJ family response regulator
MADHNVIKIAVAETSMIIRSGIIGILRSMPTYKILPIEIHKPDTLFDCLRLHQPEVLIINPTFLGYHEVLKCKEEFKHTTLKRIALICAVGDKSMYDNYDTSISLYDDAEEIYDKISCLLNTQKKEDELEDSVTGQEILSAREKEIVTCIAKGLTNKEIADQLFLSTHTVITHRRNITRKLQIHSPAGLTIYAIVNKLVEIQDIKNSLS